MNFQAALDTWNRLEFFHDESPETRARLFFAIRSAVSETTEHTQRCAMKYAGLKTDKETTLRFRAALGYMLGVLERDHTTQEETISHALPSAPSLHVVSIDGGTSQPA